MALIPLGIHTKTLNTPNRAETVPSKLKPPKTFQNHQNHTHLLQNHLKLPTMFKNSAETSQKNIPKNAVSVVPPFRPNLVSKFKTASSSMKIGTINN